MRAIGGVLVLLAFGTGAFGARADPALDRMMQNMNGRPVGQAPYNDAFCAEAKINIEWVLERDSGARATFSNAVRGGLSTLEAVVFAQQHNPHAQATIRGCRYSGQYIDAALRATFPPPVPPPPHQSSTTGAAGPQLGDPVSGYRTWTVTSREEIQVWAHNDNPFSIMLKITPTTCENIFFCHDLSNPVGPRGDNLIGVYKPDQEGAPFKAPYVSAATRASP